MLHTIPGIHHFIKKQKVSRSLLVKLINSQFLLNYIHKAITIYKTQKKESFCYHQPLVHDYSKYLPEKSKHLRELSKQLQERENKKLLGFDIHNFHCNPLSAIGTTGLVSLGFNPGISKQGSTG